MVDNLGNPILWLDAAVPSNIVVDSESQVVQWKSTGTSFPGFQSSGTPASFFGRGVRFNGSTLLAGPALSYSTDMTLLLAFESDSRLGSFPLINDIYPSDPKRGFSLFVDKHGLVRATLRGDSGYQSLAVVNSGIQIITLRLQGTSLSLRINGSEDLGFPSLAAQSLLSSDLPLILGSEGSSFFIGKLYEVVWFSSALTSSSIDLIEQVLCLRWQPSRCSRNVSSVSFQSDEFVVNGDSNSAAVVVARTGSLSGSFMVNFYIVPGTAVPFYDYSDTSATLRWAHGEGGSKVVTVPVIRSLVFRGSTISFSVFIGVNASFETSVNVTRSLAQVHIQPRPVDRMIVCVWRF